MVSTAPGANVAARWAGDGGEVPRQIEAYLVGKYSTRDVKDSRLKGEPAIVKCQIKNFDTTVHYTRIKRSIDGMNRLIADGGIGGEYPPQDAANALWGDYNNFLCKPEELEVLEVITGESQIKELARHPQGVSIG